MDKKSGGFTLVELIVVIAIIGIISVIAAPNMFGFKSIVEERICVTNRRTLEIMYEAFLIENDIDHSGTIFNQFLIDNFDEICPSVGVISFEDGKIKCSIHGNDENLPKEESPGEEVPWL